MRARRLRRFAGVAALALVAAGACTTGSPQPSGPGAGARFGGSLSVQLPPAGAIDPASVYEPSGELIARTMCDTLLRTDPATGELRAGLAESWLVSDGGSRITIRLSRSARFSDGSRVVARDVVASLTRAASPLVASASADLLRPIDGFGELRGELQATSDQDRRRLRGVQAVTDQAVEIALRTPNADFVSVLTHPITAPMPRRLIEAKGTSLDIRPVCAGPYRLRRSWHRGDGALRLERVRRYHGADPGLADTIDVRFGGSPAQGDINEVPGTESGDDASGSVVRGVAPSVEYIGLPAARGSQFTNPALRAALSMVLDRVALASPPIAGGARRPATGFLPSSLARSSVRSRACPATIPTSPDVAGARALLLRAGIDAAAVHVPLSFNDDGANGRVVEAIAATWRAALGVQVDLQPMTFGDFLRLGEQRAGYPGAFRASWSAAYPSADAWLAPLFSTAGIGVDNRSQFSSPSFDRRLERGARRATDAADRRLEYRSLEDQLCRDLPLIPLTVDERAWQLPVGTTAVGPGPAVDHSTGMVRLRRLQPTGP